MPNATASHTVPLNKLILSPRNVCKTNGDEDIESLADSIHSKGLLQNLVVSPSPEGKLFEVDAGGRRLRALQLLVARKDLARNWPVPVHVIARDDATEASLAENLQKIAMNPADEVEAFATIVSGYEEGGIDDQATRIANCARRFGRTERYVRQRLALASLAPDILDALRQGTITIAAASAYATHPDHKLQLQVFRKQEKATWNAHAPNTIRDALAGKAYAVDHKVVRYIGLDAYRAAGGRVEADLFFDEGEREMLLDPAIVDQLVGEKAEADATAFAEQHGWAGAVVKPWTGQDWSDAKTPDGFDLKWAGANNLEKNERALAVAQLAIADDGQGLELHQNCFVPATARDGDDQRTAYTPETPQQRAARERDEAIEVKAIRLAAPSVAGTALEGCAFWPANARDRWIDAIEEDDDGNFVVALLVKVPRADVEAAKAEAARRYDLEQEELAEEAAAIAAEENAADDTPADTEQVAA